MKCKGHHNQISPLNCRVKMTIRKTVLSFRAIFEGKVGPSVPHLQESVDEATCSTQPHVIKVRRRMHMGASGRITSLRTRSLILQSYNGEVYLAPTSLHPAFQSFPMFVWIPRNLFKSKKIHASGCKKINFRKM